MENTSLLKITVVQAALTLSLGGSSFAANLSAPFSLESTATLPGGVRNPRFINVLTNIETKYNQDGDLEPVGNRLNKRISWQDVLDAQSDEAQKNLVQSTVNDLKAKDPTFGDSPGNATGVVKTYANIKVPALAMGITNDLTLAVIVPIVKIDVSVDTGFTRAQDGQKFVDYICDSSPDKCNEAATKLNEATQRKLARLGYQPLNSHTVSGLGDIQLAAKYRWFGDTTSGLGSKVALVLPTGTATNPDKALDLTTGDNRFKLAVGAAYDRYLHPDVRWNTYIGYTALLPYHVVKRLPVSGDDSLSSDKERLKKAFGHQATIGTGLEYNIPPAGLVLGANVGTQFLSKTRYSGSAATGYTRTRYTALEDLEPAQVLHAVTATVGFSTVNWYREKSFPLPFQLNAAYSHPLGGRNAPRNDMVAGEMVMFF